MSYSIIYNPTLEKPFLVYKCREGKEVFLKAFCSKKAACSAIELAITFIKPEENEDAKV